MGVTNIANLFLQYLQFCHRQSWNVEGCDSQK